MSAMALAVACLLLLLPAGASASTVVNGDFESGLSGWQGVNAGNGSWFAYSGTEAPLSDESDPRFVPPPPQGSSAAISDETSAGLHILYLTSRSSQGRSRLSR